MQKKIAGNYFCENFNALRKKKVPSCLEALYEQKKDGVMTHCEIHVAKISLIVKQLTHDTFAIFNGRKGSYTTFCPSNNDAAKRQFETNDVIKVPAGCYAEIGGYHLTTRPFATTWGLSASEFTWNLSFQDIFGEHGMDEVQSLLAGWRHGTPVAQHVVLASLKRVKGTNSLWATWIGMILITGACTFICTFLCWSYKKNLNMNLCSCRHHRERGRNSVDMSSKASNTEEESEL
jgi:hypothetical protein